MGTDFKPVFSLPPQACDSHCHVFGPFDRFPMTDARKYTPEECPEARLRNLHDSLGVQRAVIVQASIHGADNRATMAAMAVDPDRYRAVVMIDDDTPDSEIRDMVDNGGVWGIRFNFNVNLGGLPDLGVVNRAVERIRDLGWHLVMQTDRVAIAAIDDFVRALPIPFVVDHMGRCDADAGIGQPEFLTLLDWMKLDGAWVKLTCPERMAPWPYTVTHGFARALLEARPDRVLWGTDFPHPRIEHLNLNDADFVDIVWKYTVSDEERHRLFVENPARLYRYPLG